MHNRWPNMAGHVYTDLDVESFAARLAAAGLDVEIMTRSYSSCVQYIRVHECDDFTLESVGPGDYLAEAMSSAIEQMYCAAQRVSSKLAKINIPHRFDVRDADSRPVYRLEHPATQVEDQRPGSKLAAQDIGSSDSSSG